MKVVLVDAGLARHEDTLRRALPASAELVVRAASAPDLPAEIADADVFVGSTLPAALAQQARSLRLIHAAGAGIDGLQLAGLPGVEVLTTGNHEASIAEFVAAGLVAVRRHLPEQDAALRHGTWRSATYDADIAQPRTLRGAATTFLGFGGIGQAAWHLLRAFGVEGIAITGRGDVDADSHGLRWAGGGRGDLHRALAESDVLVLSVPLGAATRGMVGAEELDLLGADGYLVNVGRGPVADERALYDALSQRRIAGAVLDVWYRYPDGSGRALPSEYPFAALPNVVMSPHASGVTHDTFHGRALEIAANITARSTQLGAGRPIGDR